MASVQPEAARPGDQPRLSRVAGATVLTVTLVAVLAVPVLVFGLWADWAFREGHDADGIVCLFLFVTPVVGTAAAMHRKAGSRAERLTAGALMLLMAWVAAIFVLALVTTALQ